MTEPPTMDQWRPGSPAWVTHQALQAENTVLRNHRDALLAALDALVTTWQRDRVVGWSYYTDKLAAVVAAHREPKP